MFKQKTQPEFIPKVEVKSFTKESLQQIIPVKVKITDDMANIVNRLIEDDDYAEDYKSNLISFAGVLAMPNIQVHNYFHAVKFVSLVLQDHTYLTAWKITFPDRYNAILDKGGTLKDITAHVAAYRKTKIVSKVMEQALVPSYIYNQSLFQEAINTQANIMRDPQALNKDKIAAADSVLKYTQMPEALITNKPEISEKGASIIDKLLDSVNLLAATQHTMISNGSKSANDIAKSKIFEGEYVEVNNG